ncbi:MAG: hypothetical protein JNJ88_02480 [Planctomycetes bacterium]|nr:hypothetical protein [Planctomycetota bacterium]
MSIGALYLLTMTVALQQPASAPAAAPAVRSLITLEPGAVLSYQGSARLSVSGEIEAKSSATFELRFVVLGASADGGLRVAMFRTVGLHRQKLQGVESEVPASQAAFLWTLDADLRRAGTRMAPAAQERMLEPFLDVLPLPFGKAPGSKGEKVAGDRVRTPLGLEFDAQEMWSCAEPTPQSRIVSAVPSKRPAAAAGGVEGAKLVAAARAFEVDLTHRRIRRFVASWRVELAGEVQPGHESGDLNAELKSAAVLPAAELASLVAEADALDAAVKAIEAKNESEELLESRLVRLERELAASAFAPEVRRLASVARARAAARSGAPASAPASQPAR